MVTKTHGRGHIIWILRVLFPLFESPSFDVLGDFVRHAGGKGHMPEFVPTLKIAIMLAWSFDLTVIAGAVKDLSAQLSDLWICQKAVKKRLGLCRALREIWPDGQTQANAAVIVLGFEKVLRLVGATAHHHFGAKRVVKRGE